MGYTRLILSFLTSFAMVYVMIPIVILVALRKRLYDDPNGDSRKNHTKITPNLGGIALFGGFIISILLWINFQELKFLQYIIAGSLIIFLIGFKDDIIGISPFKKLMGIVFAAAVVVVLGDVRLTSMYGLFGLFELNYYVSIMLSIFAIIALVNAINLLDGLDGLLGSISFVIFLVFGIWFLLTDNYELAIICFSNIGAILAFLKYNIVPARIFMGDTGSLLIGYFVITFAIIFIEKNSTYDILSYYYVDSSPAVAIGILILPFFDTLRVFSIRIMEKRSPFSPDRNHIHHIFRDNGFTNPQTVGILVGFQVFITVFSFYFQGLDTLLLLILILTITFSFFFLSHKILVKKSNN